MNDSIENRLSENEIMFWNFAFDDLNRTLEMIPKNKRNTYLKNIYHHNQDYDPIKKEIIKAATFGHNIIIQGLAGSGKTTLLKRYLIDDTFNQNKFLPLYVSTINDDKVVGYITEFISSVLQYIEEVKYPILLPKEMQPENISTKGDCVKATTYLQKILNEIDIPSRDLRPLIFFDDLDYAEEEWKEINNILRNFIANGNITFVFTLRPRLERIILRNPDDRIRYLYRNTEISVMLMPNILGIILSRIHMIVDIDSHSSSKDGTGFFAKLYNYFHSYEHNKNRHIYIEYLKDLGIDDIESLELRLKFPFNEAYIHFMTNVTGSNLRRVFLIAKDTVFYLRNGGKQNIEHNKSGAWAINKGLISELFMKNKQSSWEFLDLNKERLGNNVSLYYAILHIFHNEPEDEIEDSKLYEIIKKKTKGAKKIAIVSACKALSNKEWSLIDLLKKDDNTGNNYRLNKKGMYYLDVANWNEYQNVYGHHNYVFSKP